MNSSSILRSPESVYCSNFLNSHHFGLVSWYVSCQLTTKTLNKYIHRDPCPRHAHAHSRTENRHLDFVLTEDWAPLIRLIANREGLGTRLKLLIHVVRKNTQRFTKSPSLVLIKLVLTEIQRFKNVKIYKEMYGHPDAA